MTKIDITKTELVWPGKYNEDGTLKAAPRASLPFQVIETVNESRATRVSQQTKGMSLFDVYQGNEGDTFEEGWKNKLIWGDNLLVMNSLLKDFAGKIDLIYIDPPFATGADFSFYTEVGETDEEIQRKQTIIEEKVYRDTWGKGISSYLYMMYSRLQIMQDLLSITGSIYVHCDWRVNSFIRQIMDEIFGKQNFVNEIIWHYTGGGRSKKYFSRKHDVILLYSKTEKYTFNIDSTRIPYKETSGFAKGGITAKSGKHYEPHPDGTPADDVWDIPIINPLANERLNYPTQKPESLLERIIEASSNKNDLIADFFCGSGTTLSVAEKAERRWIGCDLGRWGIHVTRKRLLGIDECKPFEILNLGKYERQYWQTATFEPYDNKVEQLIYEYYAFVLKLYGAQPVPGLEHIHGKKGKSLVHIGAVDTPVTIGEIESALNECSNLNQSELHILGWEWEMGLAGPNNDIRRGGLMHKVAKDKGIKLLLFQIPREVMEQQAVDNGDIQFFELAYLEAKILKPEERSITITLKDFVIPNSELIPDDIRGKITEWSDYIDYWAVDWNFQNDTFMQGWVDYRTRKDRTLRLESDTHTYESPGKYSILIKVIDIFGNDTSQRYDIEVE